MKNFRSYLTISLILAATGLFVSCDEPYTYWDDDYYYGGGSHYWGPGDDDHGGQGGHDETNDLVLMAQYLHAHWLGNLTAHYKDENGKMVSDQFQVEIEFDQENSQATYGRGNELSYVNGELFKTRPFSWKIDNNGNISMNYDDGVKMNILWDDFELTTNTFVGTMTGVNVDEYDEFDLTKGTYARKTDMLNEDGTLPKNSASNEGLRFGGKLGMKMKNGVLVR